MRLAQPRTMPSPLQATIEEDFSFEGTSLHSGDTCRVFLSPGKENNGIRFFNANFPEAGFFPLNTQCLLPGNLATIIAPPSNVKARISTTEHFLAALHAFEIDNLDIVVLGGEIPILDGCAEYFANLLKKKGRKVQNAPRKWIRILRPVEVCQDDASASLSPSNYPEFHIQINFPAPAIGKQEMSCCLSADFFMKEIAPARTFVSADQLDYLRTIGLIKGGSLQNALVVDGEKIVNPEGKRYENEFARHKILDAIGDLYCAGFPILGRFEGKKSGHNLNRMLLQKIFSDPLNYTMIENPSFPSLTT